jgi:uncharacterized membrane protein
LKAIWAGRPRIPDGAARNHQLVSSDGLLTATVLKIARSVFTGGNGMSSVPLCRLPIVAAVVLLSPVFAFLMAIAVEILIGSLIAAGAPALLAVVAGAIGWTLFHKLWVRLSPAGSPNVCPVRSAIRY